MLSDLLGDSPLRRLRKAGLQEVIYLFIYLFPVPSLTVLRRLPGYTGLQALVT